jgi:hypothetical protein
MVGSTWPQANVLEALRIAPSVAKESRHRWLESVLLITAAMNA